MTADTYSATLGFLIMGTGNDNNVWGTNANASVFQVFEDAIANALTSTVTGGTLDLSGSPPPTAPSQVRYAALIFNGTLGSDQTIQVPNLRKFWWVQNATAGAFQLKFKTPSGSATGGIPQNSGWQLIQCDGSNVVTVSPFNSVQIQMPDGSASAPAFSDVNEPRSGWYRNSTQDWRLSINGADVLQVTGPSGSPASVVNILSPNSLQQAGVQVIPPGAEQAYAGVLLPAGWLWEDGSPYLRATYLALFNALSVTFNADTHSSTALDNITSGPAGVDLRTVGLIGAIVEGSGIPVGATIISFPAANAITLSVAATATASTVAIRIMPWGQGDGITTFNIPDRRERTLFGRGGMNGTSSPGRITAYDATKLNTAIGLESFSLAQANLPSVNFTVTGTVNVTDTHKHFIANSDAGTGSFVPLTSSNQVQQEHLNGALVDYLLSGSATAATVGLTSLTGAGSITAALAATTAASGGSGTAIKKIDPGGVTNWIIKY